MTWRCARVQIWLPDLASGDLRGLRRRQVEAHLKACSHCRRELAELKRVMQEIASHPVANPPSAYWEEFDRELHRKLVAAAPVPASRPWRPWKYLAWAAPVAAVLVLWAVMPLLRTPPGNIPGLGEYRVTRPSPAPPPAASIPPAPLDAVPQAKPALPAESMPPEPVIAAVRPQLPDQAEPAARAKLAARIPASSRSQEVESHRVSPAYGPVEVADPILGPAPEDILEGLSDQDIDMIFERLNRVGGR